MIDAVPLNRISRRKAGPTPAKDKKAGALTVQFLLKYCTGLPFEKAAAISGSHDRMGRRQQDPQWTLGLGKGHRGTPTLEQQFEWHVRAGVTDR